MNSVQPTTHCIPQISGHTRLFFVVGRPVLQIKAPAAFNGPLQGAATNTVVVPLDLPPETVAQTCRLLLQSPSVGGILVTVPYKKLLFGLADECGAAARVVGAVNALRRSAEGRIIGDLFDGAGFLSGLLAAGHRPEGQRVLILGAGGAGCAIAAALADAGIASLGIYDPRVEQAEALVQQLRSHYPGLSAQAVASPKMPCDIVINATPLGMHEDDPLPIEPALLAPGALVVDVIMEPAVTPLLRRAAELGLPTHPGRPMLDHQLPAYLDFFDLPEAARLARAALA